MWLLLFRSIIATYSLQLFIECIMIPSFKVWKKYVFVTLRKFYTKENLCKHFVFFDYCLDLYTAAAVKSGCLSNVQYLLWSGIKIYSFSFFYEF